MANRSYGLQKPVFVNYYAYVRYADGSCIEETVRVSSRKIAFAMIANKHKEAKVEVFKSQDELPVYEQERCGFIQPQHVPSKRVDLDLW